ncbi:MAG: hypothetical protein KJ702_13850 [Gammaproteobacteria bacterium]|nr:hypothetical protein [Gammaproteobacteria bacterium]
MRHQIEHFRFDLARLPISAQFETIEIQLKLTKGQDHTQSPGRYSLQLITISQMNREVANCLDTSMGIENQEKPGATYPGKLRMDCR